MLSSSFSSQSFFLKSFCLLFLQFPGKTDIEKQTIYVTLWCNCWSSWGTKVALLPHKCCLENLNFCRRSTYRMFIIFTVCAPNDVLLKFATSYLFLLLNESLLNIIFFLIHKLLQWWHNGWCLNKVTKLQSGNIQDKCGHTCILVHLVVPKIPAFGHLSCQGYILYYPVSWCVLTIRVMSSINYCDARVLLYYKDSLNSEV